METTTINYIQIGTGFHVLIFLLAVLAIFLAILIIRIPIVIAKNRGISNGDLTMIKVLSWFGIIFGVTWVIALIFSLIWDPNVQATDRIRKSGIDNDIDRLEKLHKLKQKGAISQKEFDAAKKKLLDK